MLTAITRVSMASTLTILLTACDTPSSPLLRAEPEVDSIQTRVPRTLRLYFNGAPNVERSALSLHGLSPNNLGEYPLRFLHTMSEDDLMIEIMTNPLPNGDYEVHWTFQPIDPPAAPPYSSTYRFTVQSDGQ